MRAIQLECRQPPQHGGDLGFEFGETLLVVFEMRAELTVCLVNTAECFSQSSDFDRSVSNAGKAPLATS